MLTAGQVLKLVSHQGGQNPTAVFLNWLAYAGQADQLLTPEILNNFFQDALEYPHWQQNRRALADEIRRLVESLCKHEEVLFDFSEVLWPTLIEVIEIQNLKNWVDAVNAFLTSQCRGGERFRIVHDEALQRLIAIVLFPQGHLQIREFTKKFFIREGQLAPLREDLLLHFTQDLELEEDCVQKISTGSFTSTRFILRNQKLFGATVRGLSFQTQHSLEGQEMAEVAKLFYTIKRLEQHFVKRDSNPFYLQTIESLEHCIRMLRLKDEEFIRKAPEILAQSQNAHDYVFVGDKLLGLLLRDLQHTMSEPSNPKSEALTTAVKQKEEIAWNPKNQPVPWSDLTN